MGVEWFPSRNWIVRFDAGQRMLILSGGDDEQFGVIEVDPALAEVILEAWGQGEFDDTALRQRAPGVSSILDRMILVGALIPAVSEAVDGAVGKPRSWSVLGIGPAAHPVLTRLALDGGRRFTDDGPDDELVVVVRSGGSYDDLLEATEPIGRRPHLLIDATFHHTVCVGPVIVPGITPCIGCLVSRLRSRWGESAVAPEPMAATNASLVAGLALTGVHQWFDRTSALCARSVRLDLKDWSFTSDVFLQFPGCVRCRNSPMPVIGEQAPAS